MKYLAAMMQGLFEFGKLNLLLSVHYFSRIFAVVLKITEESIWNVCVFGKLAVIYKYFNPNNAVPVSIELDSQERRYFRTLQDKSIRKILGYYHLRLEIKFLQTLQAKHCEFLLFLFGWVLLLLSF